MIPDTCFPQGFEYKLTEAAGEHAASIMEVLRDNGSTPPVSVRCNPFKISSPPEGEPVLWCRYGRYLPTRPQFTLDPHFHSGNYYVQEASSMFVDHIFRSVSETTEIKRVLDLCAAPGGKSTLYSTLAGLDCMVVANEPVRQRANILADNVRKWGLGNVVVTSNDPSHFESLREWFDVVAVDAPCSGEGMFRKNPEACNQWSENNVKMCAARQKRILSEAWKTLRPGGILIYSTCTFNREENEDNIAWLTGEFDCESAGVEIPEDWNVIRTEVGDISCFRFYPHLVRGEGFFACALRKTGQRGRPSNPKSKRNIFNDVGKAQSAKLSRWIDQPEFMRFASIGDICYGYYESAIRDIKVASENLSALHSGICMGQFFGKTLRPDHSLAMFHDVSRNAAPTATLTTEEAVSFLKRDDSFALDKLSEGMNLICYEGSPLGWAKRIGSRANNLYPKSLAIQNRQFRTPEEE